MNCASRTRIYGENIPDFYFLKKMSAVLVMHVVMEVYEIFLACLSMIALEKVIIYATVQKFVVGNIFV